MRSAKQYPVMLMLLSTYFTSNMCVTSQKGHKKYVYNLTIPHTEHMTELTKFEQHKCGNVTCTEHKLERLDGSDSTQDCPMACQCSLDKQNQVITVNCSSRGLVKIPHLPDTAREVFLQNNEIRSVPCHIFTGLSHVQTLNLAYNTIEDFYNCSFHDLKSLNDLNLAGCGITILPPRVLDPLLELQVLDLSTNNLTILDNQPFRALINLVRLDLSSNKLAHIKNGTFYGLKSLTQLSLRSNLLYYIESTFEPESFGGLPSLYTLQIQGNQPDFVANFTYPDLALSRLTSLRRLSLDGFPQPFGIGFASLTNLSLISFRDSESFCNLESPPPNFFANLNTKRPLDLMLLDCKIGMIPREFFEHTPTINALYLNENNELGFDDFETGSYGLMNSNLTFLDISHIIKKENYESRIKDTTFQYLRNTKLKEVRVIHNHLTYISPRAIIDLPLTMVYLSVHDNDIIRPEFLISLIRLKNLKVFDASMQVHFRRKNIFSEGLKERNEYENIEFNQQHILEQERLALSSHMLTEQSSGKARESDDFCGDFSTGNLKELNDNGYFVIPLPKSLEEVNFGDTNLRYNIPKTRFMHNKVLKILVFSQNGIKCFDGPIWGLPSLELLDLSGNYCLKTSTHIFSDLPNLKTLLLYDNVLGQSLAYDVNGTIFSTLLRLESLNLHNNGIKDLSEEAFTMNSQLHNLNLSQNQLTNFNPSLANNLELNNLDLSTNILRGFTETNCQQFSYIKKQNANFSVLIANNKFLCNCENIPFLELLLQQPEIFLDVESFQCQLSNGSQLTYSKLEHFLPLLGSQCVAQSVFVAVLIAFSLVILLFGIASAFHYNRWQWKYLYHLGRFRLNMDAMDIRYRPRERIFVTYDQENLFFRGLMHNKFLPRLRQAELSFVLGEVDFPPGPIAASIAGALTNTRKTLVVFSRNIFEDSERELEINLAIMHELHVGRHVLVPVLHFGHLLDLQEDIVEYDIELDEQHHLLHIDDWTNGGGLHCYTEEEQEIICDLLDTYPPEIAKYLYSQIHRCLIYDGGSELFWRCLVSALLRD